MKTKHLFLILVMLCIEHYGSANTPLPQIGAKWYYSTMFMTPDMGYYQLEYVNDTTIDNKNCKIFEGIDVNSRKQVTSRSFFYLLYDGGRILQYVDSDFHLLYDFNAKVGDTIKTTYPSIHHPQTDIAMKLKVTEVKDTLINNVLLKSYSFYSIDSDINDECIGFSGKAIENIGNVTGYFFPLDCLVTDMIKPTDFRCYQNGNWVFKSESYKNKECDYTYAYSPNATEMHLFEKDVKIMFREHNNSIIISETGTAKPNLVIYDGVGKICFKADLQNDVPMSISELRPGIYLLVIQLDSNFINVKFNKK